MIHGRTFPAFCLGWEGIVFLSSTHEVTYTFGEDTTSPAGEKSYYDWYQITHEVSCYVLLHHTQSIPK